jgi:hypothetical protein
MEKNLNRFEIEHGDKIARIEKLSVAGQTIFRVDYEGSPVFITRATNALGARFWTSVPEGRRKFAEEIGPLIEKYFKSKS